MISASLRHSRFLVVIAVALTALSSCDRSAGAGAKARNDNGAATPEVSVTRVVRKAIDRQLTVSSELVPFQEIDIFAKESGYIKQLLVDYGSHVQKGQLLAVLEIPELQANLQQDRSGIKSLEDQVTNSERQLDRTQAQHKVLHLEFERINNVAQTKPGLVAQQEVDDVQGRDLAAEAQVEAARSNVEMARSNLAASEAKLEHDQDLFSYARITAPFTGVVTQRYANMGALLQAGTNSSTQAMPLVKLSQEDVYRLVIPVPETYVSAIAVGDPVSVHVPASNETLTGKVARFSFDVHQETRTMHTEVDVPNPRKTLLPGMYAEVTLNLTKDTDALVVPMEALERESDQGNVYIVDGASKVEIRRVTLGPETANDIEIESGLREGDEVILSDRASLSSGELVRAHFAGGPDAKGKN